MINNIGRTRRRAKTENTALGGSVPSIFVETVVINYFPYSFRLRSNLKVDRHISGKFLGQTSRALDKIGCFPDNIIRCISCQLGL